MPTAKIQKLSFVIGDICNAKCPFCWQENRRGETEHNKWFPEMSGESFKAVVDHFKDIECVEIVSWGEPMANPHFGEMLDVLVERQLPLHMITNGSLINRFLAKMMSLPGGRITVSIDAPEENLYEELRVGLSWKRLINNIGLFKFSNDGRYQLGVNMVVFEKTVAHMSAMADFCEAKGIDYLWFLRLIEHSEMRGQAVSSDDPRVVEGLTYARSKNIVVREAITLSETGAQQITAEQTSHCLYPWIQLVVDPRGDTRPCCRWFPGGADYGKSFGSYKTAWEGAMLEKLRLQMETGSVDPVEFSACAKCEYLGTTVLSKGQKRLPVIV